MENFTTEDIDYICNKILKNFELNKNLIPYVNQVCEKVKIFLSKKSKVKNFDDDLFTGYIVDKINNRKVKENTHVGVLAAQSIGEPVTQSALSYFHKLTGDANSSNGLKELCNVTHNKLDYSVAEFYLKSNNPDGALKKK
ncbi:hypothetical protein PIROE2DRAFT_65144 [Piromyces sp. E2]|nr:hypothetical protein PIROE2DRAFT_65144 [Piromyces sp. E2]|eukprot:OUM57195.1 hypothetical protein PIROE2DRAFT_65144 [Piromyces sp. E2]